MVAVPDDSFATTEMIDPPDPPDPPNPPGASLAAPSAAVLPEISVSVIDNCARPLLPLAKREITEPPLPPSPLSPP